MVYNIHIAGSIHAFCHLRPFHGNEKRACPEPIVATYLEQVLVKDGERLKAYHFDKVFLPEDSQGTKKCF